MPVLTTVDSPDAATTLGEHLDGFDSGTRNRGTHYHRAARVRNLKRMDDHTITASVTGTELYETTLLRDGPLWANLCTCPVGENCKHAFAVGLAWIALLRRTPPASAPGPFVVPTAPSLATPVAGVAPSTPSHRGAFRAQWEPILAAKLGRPLAAAEGAFLGKLSQVFHNLLQSGRVSSVDLGRLGFATHESRRAPFENVFDDWWEEPPRDPLELWQYIAYDIESSGLVVPEFMRPVTDTALVRAHVHDRERREAIERWNARFDHLLNAQASAAARRADAPPESLDLRLSVGGGKWVLETRARPEAPWKSAPRAFLDRFTRIDPGGLAALDASPAVYAFLAICQEHYRRTYSIAINSGSLGARELLQRLLAHRLARTLVVGPSGAPVAFSDTPLVWSLAHSATSGRDYELSLLLPDGSLLPPAATHLPGQPDFYLHNATVFRGPPPLDGNSAAAAIVPAEVVERPDVLRTLRQFGTKLPPEIEARFVTVPLRARIECRLSFDFTEKEILALNLLAVSTAPPLERTWRPGGWTEPLKKASPSTAGAEEKLFSFDLSTPDLVVPRLNELRVVFDPHLRRWTRRVTKTFAEEFIAWREALPPGVEVLATGELASLLGAPVRARVEFELIEAAAHRDWFDLALALRPEDSTLTPDEIALLLKARGGLVRLPGKGWRRLQVDLDDASGAALQAAGFDVAALADPATAGERHRFHALQLAQAGVLDLLPERQASALRARAGELTRPAAPALPAGLLAELRPYQIDGFEFLAFLSSNRLGGVLADDMGLGKTLQALAWLLWLASLRPAGEPLRALVVCPKSVVGNWEAETARFAPSLEVVRFSPSTAARDLSARAGRPRIVVANYTQLRLQAELLGEHPWHAVILDEAQFIKNPAAKVAQIARDLPGEHRLVLTGTPIENRLLDLWSLFSFALPGLLGTQAAFKRHYPQDDALALARLRTRVRHFLLRRTKGQVASDLPARTEEDVVVDLEGEQARLYQAELKRARAQLLGVKTDRQFDRARFNILASLLRLRQICCHPMLIDSAHREAPSAKLDALLERVEELRDEGHQVLVFSQFVTMLEIIRDRLVAADIGHLLLTGQTENRDELVRQFQTDRRHTVFLLSLKAAGFGLNLTAASYVVLYDPWWNPAVEAQAIDRTHRIGQTQPVNAYRLVARGTVEEKIRALQKEKAALAAAVVQEESLASVLDLDSLRQILG